MKSIFNATHTVGGHKILRCKDMGSFGISVTVEDKSWAAGHVTYALGKSGRCKQNPIYSIKPV